ncbi:MAG TPA: hypothetical protein DD490_11105 [Acidobacteria bacterium]|nr:hypothetical protein [Acidobacteriota bacterium]
MIEKIGILVLGVLLGGVGKLVFDALATHRKARALELLWLTELAELSTSSSTLMDRYQAARQLLQDSLARHESGKIVQRSHFDATAATLLGVAAKCFSRSGGGYAEVYTEVENALRRYQVQLGAASLRRVLLATRTAQEALGAQRSAGA